MSSNTASITTSAGLAAASMPTGHPRQRHQPAAPLHILGAEPAARHRRPVVGGNSVTPLLQLLVARLDQRDRNAGIGKAHRNAAAHRTGAEHRRAGNRARFGTRRAYWAPLPPRVLGEEDMALRLRLIASDEFAKQLAFAPQTFIKGQGEGIAHRLDASRRRLATAQAAGQRRRSLVERAGFPLVLPRACRRGRELAAAGAFPRRLAGKKR